VEHVVLAKVALGPVALAVGDAVAPADHEGPNPVTALTTEGALAEGEAQFHPVPAGDDRLKEVARPRPAGEAGDGFQVALFRRRHGTIPSEVRKRNSTILSRAAKGCRLPSLPSGRRRR